MVAGGGAPTATVFSGGVRVFRTFRVWDEYAYILPEARQERGPILVSWAFRESGSREKLTKMLVTSSYELRFTQTLYR